MTDQRFEEFLSLSMNNFGAEFTVPDKSMFETHVFSERSEKRMLRLIRRQKFFFFPTVHASPRRMTATMLTLIILISAATLTVSAAVEMIEGFLVDEYEDHSDVQLVDCEGAPETIEEVYEIDVPEGFEVVDQLELNEQSFLSFTEYHKDDLFFSFSQITKSKYDYRVNTEDNEMIPVVINGLQGYEVNFNVNDVLISWIDTDYAFMISGNIGKSELINIAESVHKVE